MAQRRMFSLEVVDTDLFLELPPSAQNLYFHLGMRADDDGFISNTKKIMKIVDASAEDLFLLVAKKFLLGFPSGVYVIRDWKLNNYIQKDRYHQTRYLEEKGKLTVLDSGSYAYADPCRVQPVPAPDTSCTQSVSDMDTEVRLGKDRIDKDRIDKDRIEQESHTGRAAIQARPDGASEHPAASGGGMPPPPEDLEEYHRWLMAPFQRHIVPGGELKC